jgi:hypothetical protein
MKRKTNDDDAVATFQRLMTAAEAFVNRAPKAKRMEAERTALVDAIADAQLRLSLRRLPPPRTPSRAKGGGEDVGRLKRDLQTADRRIAAMGRELHTLKTHIETLRESAENAESVLNRTLAESKDNDEAAA